MFRFELQTPGLLVVETSGFWTLEEADQYLAQLRQHVRDLRLRQGYSLVLVDGRDSAVQSAAVMERVGNIQSLLIEGPRDRAAYVVETSLAKMQAQRLSTSDQLKVFVSPGAARTWVLAYHGTAADSGA